MLRRPSLSDLNISDRELANLDQILYEASFGWEKGSIRFWGRLDKNEDNLKITDEFDFEKDRRRKDVL